MFRTSFTRMEWLFSWIYSTPVYQSDYFWQHGLKYAIYTTCNYARHLKNEEFLTHLAYLFEEGISLTPDMEASELYHNVAYGARRETSFFAPYIKGSLFWHIFNFNSGNYILYLYKFKI